MSSMIYKKKSPLILFLVPAFLFLLVYLYYPFFQNIVNTFMKIGGLGRAAEGLNEPWYENYQRLWTDPYMRTALKNTLLLTVCTIVFQVGIALILAGAHFLIFLIICAVYRAQMRELNKMQKKYLNDNQKTDGGTT